MRNLRVRKSFVVSFFLHIMIIPLLAGILITTTMAKNKVPETIMQLSFDNTSNNAGFEHGSNGNAGKSKGDHLQPSSSKIQGKLTSTVPGNAVEKKDAAYVEKTITDTSSELVKKTMMTASSDELPAHRAGKAFGGKSSNSSKGKNGSLNGENSGSNGSGAENEVGSGIGNRKSTHKGISPPRVLSSVEPDYPAVTRMEYTEGSVTLKVEILTNGKPGDIVIINSSGKDVFDQAAIKAIHQWRFIPAKDAEGNPFVVHVIQKIKFHLID